jgi:hypothetical protein
MTLSAVPEGLGLAVAASSGALLQLLLWACSVLVNIPGVVGVEIEYITKQADMSVRMPVTHKNPCIGVFKAASAGNVMRNFVQTLCMQPSGGHSCLA